jgi:hypothetical protein
MQKTDLKTKKLDNISIWLSGFCVIHCLALPVITIGIPLFGGFFDRHYHAIMLFLIVPISVVALFRGFHNHRKILISGLGCFGVVMILIGGTIMHNQYSALTDSLITISGSVILALAHFLNNRTDHHHSVSCK